MVNQKIKNCQHIIEEAYAMSSKQPFLRYGQSVFNVAYKYFPQEVKKLTNTDYDCFYRDDRVDEFLNKLYEELGIG